MRNLTYGKKLSHKKGSKSQQSEVMYPSENETQLRVSINLLQQKIYRTVDSDLKKNGLPPLRWYDVLWDLERQGEKGRRAFELEKTLLFEQSNLSRLLRKMIDEGLVEELIVSEDRRSKTLKVTMKGIKLRKEMWRTYGPHIHGFMGHLEDEAKLEKTAATLMALLAQN